jgi:hypothetical protein
VGSLAPPSPNQSLDLICLQNWLILNGKGRSTGHAEIAKLEGGIGSAKMRGQGEPLAFACAECAATEVSVIVGFVYWDFDLMLDEPELSGQEFFNEFLIYGRCASCGKSSSVANLGKL